MVDIPFPLSTAPGQTAQEGAGRLINCYAEPRGDAVGGTPVYHRAPGLRILGSDLSAGTWTAWSFPPEEWFSVREQPTGAGQFRGGCVVNTNLYGAFGTTVYTVDATGSFTALTGTLAGTDKVFFARNNNATPQVAMVCSAGAFYVNGTAVQSYPDGDVGSPTCVCFHDGYFMFGAGNGTIIASGINTTAINALDFTTAESNPDGISQLWSFGGQLYAAGPATIEVYGLPINATAFPLTRVGYNITPGLITPGAVAGFEPEFGVSPIYCASDNTVRWLQGFTPVKISPPDLDKLIADVSDKTTLEALCYISRGHAMWQLSSDSWTWVFNTNNQKWHERTSYLLNRSRMSISIPAFSEWLVGDTQTSDILKIDPSIATEAGNPLVVTIDSSPVEQFPNRMRVQRADFDFTTGVGISTGTDPIETNPSVMVSWSDDGGVNFTNPWVRRLGKQDVTQQRITVLNTGLTGVKGRIWRLSVSDPIHFGLQGGTMDSPAVDH